MQRTTNLCEHSEQINLHSPTANCELVFYSKLILIDTYKNRGVTYGNNRKGFNKFQRANR